MSRAGDEKRVALWVHAPSRQCQRSPPPSNFHVHDRHPLLLNCSSRNINAHIVTIIVSTSHLVLFLELPS